MADLVVSITRILMMLFNVILHFGCAIEYYFSPLSSADHEAPKIDCMMTALGHLTLGISIIGLGIAGKYGELGIVVLSYLWVLIAEVWLLWRGKQYNEAKILGVLGTAILGYTLSKEVLWCTALQH